MVWYPSRVFVVSSGGDQLEHQYNIDNSPLFDNLITALHFDGTSEMFIGTGSGVQSIPHRGYSGSLTKSIQRYLCLSKSCKAEYNGPISIQGMRQKQSYQDYKF